VSETPPPRSYPEDESPFRESRKEPLLHRSLPVTRDLRSYRPKAARSDLTAALTVAALAIPSAMAYAQVAGLAPVIGLYALLLPTIAYALLGSSRQVVVGPEGSLAALVAASVLSLAAKGSAEAGELAAMLALLTALFYGVAWVARLGWIADYFSRPVLIGYIHGVAVVLIIGQLGKLLGLDVKALDPIPQLVEVAKEIGQTSWVTVAVGITSLAILLTLRQLAPRIPAALVVLVGGIVASYLLNLSDHGVAVVGHIPRGLPGLGFPTPSVSATFDLVPGAIGLFLVSFADEILTARSYAGLHREHIRPSQELLAMGAAQAVAGISHGMPVGASGSRTAVNDGMGARSQISGLLAAAAVAVVLLFLTAPIAQLPKAVLGAAIVSAAIGLINPPAWRELWSTDRVETSIAAVTTAGVIITGVLNAIVFAVGLSIVDVVRRSAQPHDAVLGWVPRLGRWGDVAVHRSARITAGVVVYRLDDRLFFANASYVKGRIREALRGVPSEPHWLVLDAQAIGHIDAAGMGALRELTDSLADQGVTLVVARMTSRIEGQLIDAGVADEIGREHFYPTVEAAVEACVADMPVTPSAPSA
jgi:sulfate permease, SulP family